MRKRLSLEHRGEKFGAYLAPYPDEALTQSLAMLAGVPAFRPEVTPWARTAFAVRTVYPQARAGESLSRARHW